MREVSNNPELTKADFAKAQPFSKVFPDLSASIRKGRGPNKSPKEARLLAPQPGSHCAFQIDRARLAIADRRDLAQGGQA
jgi:hypothetical protein